MGSYDVGLLMLKRSPNYLQKKKEEPMYEFINERTFLVVLATVIVSNCSTNMDNYETEKGVEGKIFNLDNLNEIKGDINDNLQEWDESIVIPTIDSDNNLYEDKNPMELAEQVSDQNYFYEGVRNNDKIVYKNGARNSTVKFREIDKYWKIINVFTPTVPSDPSLRINNDDAIRLALSLFSTFGLPLDQIGTSDAHTVVVNDPQHPDNSMVRLITVIIDRRINNINVNQSFMKATFDMSGNLYQMEVRWPKFTLENKTSFPLKDRELVLDDLAEYYIVKMGEMDKDIIDIRTALEYFYIPSERIYTPSVMIATTDKFDSPTQMIVIRHYSLSRGLLDIADGEVQNISEGSIVYTEKNI
jgi:hypothetical protein